jgi:hypothetical protein
MRSGKFELPLRIVVADPFPGVSLALQRGAAGKAELAAPDAASAEAIVFELEITVDGALPDGRPRLLGPCVQGPPAERFVYLCVGAYAGQSTSPWAGRIKVPLSGIDWPAIEALAPGQRLEGRVAGKGKRDGPALATVPILPPGWRA